MKNYVCLLLALIVASTGCSVTRYYGVGVGKYRVNGGWYYKAHPHPSSNGVPHHSQGHSFKRGH